MIYLFFTILFLIGTLNYEGGNVVRKNPRYLAVLCLLLTLMSGLQYRMGADVISYMKEYTLYNVDYSWEYLSGFDIRQPLWVLLNVLCKTITEDFLLLKIIQAIFVNIVFFRFYNKYSATPFLSTFLYFIILFLPLNFNELRQSVAISVFLLAYDFLIREKYLKYYLLVIVAYLFHESAMIVAVFPLAKFFSLKEKTLLRIYFLLVLGVIIAFSFKDSILSLMLGLLLSTGDSGLITIGERYFDSSLFGGFEMTIFGMIERVVFIVFYMWILFFNISKGLVKNRYESFAFVMYLILYILNSVFPIFYRFGEFYSPFFILLSANMIYHVAKSFQPRFVGKMAIFFMLFFFAFISNKFLFNKAYYGEKPIVQYYPYTSVFDQKLVPARERAFQDKEDEVVLY